MYATVCRREGGTISAHGLAREGRALGALLGISSGFIACFLLATPDGCAAIGNVEGEADLAVTGWAPSGLWVRSSPTSMRAADFVADARSRRATSDAITFSAVPSRLRAASRTRPPPMPPRA
jgi:hypothetical protein